MARIEYDVHINGADNGIVIQIGCKTLVFKNEEVPAALADLSEYLTDGYDALHTLRAKYFKESKPEIQAGCAMQEAPAQPGHLR